MARDITLTFDDGTSHTYKGAPDDITPDQVISRAGKDFAGKGIENIDGGRGGQAPAQEPAQPKVDRWGRSTEVVAPKLVEQKPGLFSRAADAVMSGVQSLADPETYRMARTPEDDAKAAQALRGLRGQPDESSVLDGPAPAGLVGQPSVSASSQGPVGYEKVGMAPPQPRPVDQSTPAPMNPAHFRKIKDELAAMPRQDREKLQQDAKGWRGTAAKAANAQIDQAQAQPIEGTRSPEQKVQAWGEDAKLDKMADTPRDALTMATDFGRAIRGGTANLAGSTIKFASPSNEFAEALLDVAKEEFGSVSDVQKAKEKRMRRRVSSVDRDSIIDQAGAYLSGVANDPSLALTEIGKQVSSLMTLGAVGSLGRVAGAGVVWAGEAVSPVYAISRAIGSSAGVASRVPVATSVAAQALTGASMGGGDAVQQTYEHLMDKKKTPDALLSKNPDYQKVLQAAISEGQTPQVAAETARQAIAESRARLASIVPALMGALAGTTGLQSRSPVSSFAGKSKRAATETLGELGEEGATQVSSNVAIGSIDPSHSWSRDLGQTLGQTLVGTGPMAGVAYLQGGNEKAAPGSTQPRTPTPLELAHAKGFTVSPPLTTDTPSTQRSKLGGMFKDLGSMYGLPKEAVDATIAAADGQPLGAMGGFLKRAAAAMQRRGLFAQDPHPDVMGVFDGPHDPEQQAREQEQAQAMADEAAQAPESQADFSGLADQPAPAMDSPDAVPGVPQGSIAEAMQQDAPQEDAPLPLAVQIDDAAHQAATSPLNDKPQPSDAQKEAGNYAKGHLTLHGMDIAIENPAGSTRSGVSPDGVAWESTMQHHYGYIKGTVGNDKDHVDTFIGQNPESTKAFVIDQIDPKTGAFDEHKIVLGADSAEQAREIYQANYAKGWKGLAAMTEMPMPEFKAWVKDGAKTQPLGDISAQAKPAGPAFEIDRKADGTVTVLGDPAAIKAAFPGVKGIAGTRGVTYGKSVAPSVVEALTPKQPAPDVAESSDAPDVAPAKIFKTRKAAEVHRNSLGNGMRLQKVKGGYKLRAKSDAELAAEAKSAQRLKQGKTTDVQGDSLLVAIAKAGGLAMSEKADTIGEGNKNAGGKMVFTTNGKPLDIMAQTLAEDGYIPPQELESDGGISWLQNAIGEEFGGHAQHFSHNGEDWMRKRAEAERGDAPDYEAAGISDENLSEDGYFGLTDEEAAQMNASFSAELDAQLDGNDLAEEAFWRSVSDVEQQEEYHARQEQDHSADAENAGRDRGDQEPATQEPTQGDRRSTEAQGQNGEEQEGLTAPLVDGALIIVRQETIELAPTKAQQQGSFGAYATGEYLISVQQFPSGNGIALAVVKRSGQSVRVMQAPSEMLESSAFAKLNKAAKDLFDQSSISDSANSGQLLESQSLQDLQDKADREEAAEKSAATKKAIEQERLRRAAEARDNKHQADATVDNFQLGQSADEQLAAQDGLFGDGAQNSAQSNDATNEVGATKAEPDSRAKPSDIKIKASDSDSMRQAKADAMKALGDLADIFGKNTKLNMVPEQEQKILPVLTRLFDAAFRMGYLKFKDAAKFALDQIRGALGNDVADQITLEHLQGGYIGMSGRYKGKGADAVMDVAKVGSLSEITDNQEKESANNVSNPRNDLESDRQDTVSGERVLAQPDGNESGRPDQGAGQAGDRAGSQGRGRDGDQGLRSGGATLEGERGDQPVSGGETVARPTLVPAGADIDQRGGGYGDTGIPVETVPAGATRAVSQDGLAQGLANKAQRTAPTEIKPGDLDSIRETLPLLQPKQQEDAHKAETRFAKPDGYGMLFTNGTGTGKTYTGLGVVKRFALQGKENTIVVVPSDKIMEDWISTGKRLGLNITPLANTQDAGKGIVITTYANFGDNKTLGDRKWDLVVTDEAHYLMQAEDGKPTNSLAALRAITMHPDGAHTLHEIRNRADIDLLKQVNLKLKDIAGNGVSSSAYRQATAERAAELEIERDKLNAKLSAAREAIKQEVADAQASGRARVTFLSATPFAYVPTVDWANGYLFDYHEGQSNEGAESRGYNSGSNRERFFMQHFGYRMRYNKLARPDAKVNVSLMERQFNGWLRKSGALSGRMLEVEADYDRRFVLVDSAIGSRIDEALTWVSDQGRADKESGREAHPGFRALADVLNKKFDYLSRRYLLEAIKAQESIEHVKAHLAMGRKVVVFHDYKKGGGFNPFDIEAASEQDEELVGAGDVEALNEAIREFRREFSDLVRYPFAVMPSPIEAYKKAFPQVLLFNGDVKPADRRANVAKFQDDATGPTVILVQSAAGKEGISLHDTTGKHQRALLNLGQPTQPTTAIQQEGRIYRTGQKTDAVFRYFNTGTNWEKWAFATTIATRSSTAENLSMGEQARALKDAFIAAFEESDAYPAGHEGEGKGGKERDKAANEALTEFDRAVSFYFGTQKKNSRTKAQEGADYFATPEPLGLKMVEWLGAHGGDHLLEPSAGHGAIARWMPENTERTAVEPSPTLRPRLAMAYDGKIIASQFEDLHVSNKYDGIVMNPPFGSGGKLAIEHLAKAATHLRAGGRIVALIPTGPAADKRFDKWFYDESTKPLKPLGIIEIAGKETPIYKGDTVEARGGWAPSGTVTGWRDGAPLVKEAAPEFRGVGSSLVAGSDIRSVKPTGPRTEAFRPAEGLHLVAEIQLPQSTFERAGTGVATRVMVIERPIEGQNPPGPRTIDMRDASDINALFDRLRHTDVGNRAKPEPAVAEEVDEGAALVKANGSKRGAAAKVDGSWSMQRAERINSAIQELNAARDIARGSVKSHLDGAVDFLEKHGDVQGAVDLTERAARTTGDGQTLASISPALDALRAEGVKPQVGKAGKAEAQAFGSSQAASAGMEIIEHVTGKGKTLRGVVRTDLTQAQAKEIDAYTFKKAGGFFIRAEHIPALLEKFPSDTGGGVAQEPIATYHTGTYETDLFGHPVQTTARASRAKAAERPAESGDVQRAGDVQDTAAPDGEYFARTIIGSTQQRRLGASVVKTASQAAAATRYLYKSAVERFDAIVTDENHKPLAVVGGFKGALSQTSVYASTIVGEAIRIKGAAHIWFSHNHPSGVPDLSRADENLWQSIREVLRGSGIKPLGLIAVGNNKFGYVEDGGHSGSLTMDAEGMNGGAIVPVVDREVVESSADARVIDSPVIAKQVAREFYGRSGAPGLLLLNAQQHVNAWVPLQKNMLGALRDTGGMNALYRAVSESNAGAVIMVHGGELDVRGNLPAGVSVGENIGAALSKVDVRVLDSINAKTSQSAAERGQALTAGPVFSLKAGGKSVAGNNGGASITREEIDRVVAAYVNKVKAIGLNQVVVLESASDFPLEAKEAMHEQGAAPEDIYGVFLHGKFYLYRPNILNAAHAEEVLFHEVYGHLGLAAVLGNRTIGTLNKLWFSLNGLAGIKKIAEKHKFPDGKTVWDRLQPYIDGTRKMPAAKRQAIIVDELIAHLAQRHDTTALTRFKGYLSDMKAAVVAFLRRHGLDGMADKLAHSAVEFDALALVRDARNALIEGKTKDGRVITFVRKTADGETNPAFSLTQGEAPPQTESDALKRWFGDSKVVESGLEELLSKPDGVGVLLRDLLAAQNATGSGLNPVQALMLALAKNDKIGRGIVGLVPVDVVNSFSKDGLRPKDGGGNTSMFVNALNAPVSDQVLSTFRGILTSLSTKLANAIATGRDQEIAPALLASDFNLREVGGLLSLQGSTDFWGGNTGVKSVSAGEAAKSTSPGLGSPAKDFKLDATALADLFNKFVSFAPHAKTSISDDLPSAKYIAKQGKPLVVYHGTNEEFNVFQTSADGVYGPGSYLTKYDGDAATYGRNVMPVYASLQNPYVATPGEARRAKKDGGTKAWSKSIQDRGYDGIILQDMSVVVAFRPEQIKSAIGNNGDFDPGNDDIRFSRAPKTETVAEAALRKAGLGRKASLGQRIKDALGKASNLARERSTLADEFQQGALDQFAGIKRAVNRELGGLPTDQDPYVAARLANGATSAVMRALMMHGKAKWADNGMHLEKVDGSKGLLEILAPLGDDLNTWFGWMVGNRAARLMAEGRENNFTKGEIDALQALGNGKKAVFGKAALAYADFKRSVLDVAQGAGLLDAEARKVWDNADYIPFYRQIDEKATFSATGRNGMAGQSSGIRILKGGDSAINDPFENVLMNFSRLIDASLKNNAVLKTVDALSGSGVIQKVGYDMASAIVPRAQIEGELIRNGVSPQILAMLPPDAFDGMAKMWSIKAPTGPDIIRVMRGGKPEFYRVGDHLLLKAVTSFIPLDFPGLGLARWFRRTLTRTVTSTPQFMAANFIRDSAASMVIGRDGFNPASAIKGVAKSYMESGAGEEMLFSGASFQSGAVNATDPTSTAKAMRRALRKRGMSALTVDSFMGTILDKGLTGIEKYHDVGDAIENGNREAAYEAAIKAGKSATAAAYESKDLMDFSLRGSSPIYQVMADTLPFFNARVQGLYRLGRSDPKLFTRQFYKTRLFGYGMMMMAASLLLAWANDGEDWYEELPDWDKDTFWHIKLDGHHFRIPKPFELGVIFATVPERIGRYIKGQDAGSKVAGRAWANLSDQLAFDVVPQMIRPGLNAWANKDTFRDSPIEGQADEGKLPHMRYGGNTSATTKALLGMTAPVTDTIGLSPKNMEYLVGGYFGTVGLYALGLSDMAVRAAQGAPTGPALRLDDIPVVKTFYRMDPARSTVFESDLYKMREEIEKIHRSVTTLQKSGNGEQAREMMADNREELRARGAVNSATKALSQLNKVRDSIYASESMTADQKRVRLDQIQTQKNAISKRAMTSQVVKAAL